VIVITRAEHPGRPVAIMRNLNIDKAPRSDSSATDDYLDNQMYCLVYLGQFIGIVFICDRSGPLC